MTCSACITNFLDLSLVEGDIRSIVSTSLDIAKSLPVDDFQSKLDGFNDYFSFIGEQVNEFANQIDTNDNTLATIQQAMIDNNIDPGDCPELDSLIVMVGNLNTVITTSLKNPVDKVFGTVEAGIGELNQAIINFNILTALAESFSIC